MNINSCLQALTKDLSTPADIAPSALETIIFYCFMGYMHWLITYYYLLFLFRHYIESVYRTTLSITVVDTAQATFDVSRSRLASSAHYTPTGVQSKRPSHTASSNYISWTPYAAQYTVSQKKQDTKLLPITSPNVNRFSKFFHWQTHW